MTIGLGSVPTLAVIALAAVGAMRWRGAVPTASTPPRSFARTVPSQPDSLDQGLADAEDLIVSNDPFRLSNTPATVRFDPNNENGVAGAPIVSPPPIRPNMTLKAIVGGPPWQAVVDGIPGQPQGTIVRVGAAFDKLVARAVTRDSVIIQGPDTAWVLTFRRHP